jgi:hypothetical protein
MIRLIKYHLCEPIFTRLEKLSVWLDRMAWKFAFCPDCGRNRYTGKPCVEFKNGVEFRNGKEVKRDGN